MGFKDIKLYYFDDKLSIIYKKLVNFKFIVYVLKEMLLNL